MPPSGPAHSRHAVFVGSDKGKEPQEGKRAARLGENLESVLLSRLRRETFQEEEVASCVNCGPEILEDNGCTVNAGSASVVTLTRGSQRPGGK